MLDIEKCCTVWTCVPFRDPKYKPSLSQRTSDELIGIKSKVRIWDANTAKCLNYKATHSEFRFSQKRYGGISVSATGQDSCKCVRFKQINYMKHPKRWFPVYLDIPTECEDAMFAQACRDADTPYLLHTYEHLPQKPGDGQIFYGNNSLPYDYRRVVTANIMNCRIIPGMKNAVWCSEYVYSLLKVWDLMKFPSKPDTIRPDMCYYAAKQSMS